MGCVTAIEIKLASDKLLLDVVCYRAPNDHEFVTQFKIIDDVASQDKYSMTMITGDFNYPGIRWVDGSGFVSNDIGVEYEFTILLSDAFLYQLVDAPTRGINILDLVLSSNVDLVDTVFVENTNGLPSDHKRISFNLFRLLKLNNQPPRYIYDFKKADFETLRTHLSENINDIFHEITDDALIKVMEE